VKDSGNQTAHSHYLAYPIERETPYPAPVPINRRFTLTIRCDITRREAICTIDEGPAVSLPLGDITGLCYVAVAADNGGALRVRKIETVDEAE